jgi:hypothetical protein
MGYLDLSRQRVVDAQSSPDQSHALPDYGINGINGKSVSLRDAVLEVAAAEYDRLGEQIDALADQAKAARARGDMAEGDRLGAEVRALVVGPYLQARERFAALLPEADRLTRDVSVTTRPDARS